MHNSSNGRSDCVFGYRAFGLYLISDSPLPWLTQCDNPGLPEIRVYMGSQPPEFDGTKYQ